MSSRDNKIMQPKIGATNKQQTSRGSRNSSQRSVIMDTAAQSEGSSSKNVATKTAAADCSTNSNNNNHQRTRTSGKDEKPSGKQRTTTTNRVDGGGHSKNARGASSKGSSGSKGSMQRSRISTKTNNKDQQQDEEAERLLIIGESTTDDNSTCNEMSTHSVSYNAVCDDLNNQMMEQETDVDGDEISGSEETGLLIETRNSSISQVHDNGARAEPSSRIVSESTGANNDDLPHGWEQHSDKMGAYFWHVATGVIQRTRPVASSRAGAADSGTRMQRSATTTEIVVYHDDEEINQAPKTSSSEEEEDGDRTEDFYDTGAALTLDDTSESSFIVYPLGCCEFDETQLISATSSKAIQKCILRLSNKPDEEQTYCWGLDQSQPILMKLYDDHIQFTDLNTQLLLRSQPIQTIRTWAVDDNNNFAFVVEDRPVGSGNNQQQADSVDYALLSEPQLMCYVFRSVDEDDMMSCRVAAKLNEEINRYKEQILHRITKSTRLQQMGEPTTTKLREQTDDDDDDLDDMEASNELTMNVKYIGKLPVPRPTGIEVLNVAIDKCLADAARRARQAVDPMDENIHVDNGSLNGLGEPLIEAKLHVSPSSVIVENVTTGEIIVECRIRYLTFMGISKRDIRWCGFIMQNATNKTFVAHCFECHPTAGHVCEAIQLSCNRMYEKVVKQNAANNRNQVPETMSIIPSSSKIRNTLAKTLSRIKLNPIK